MAEAYDTRGARRRALAALAASSSPSTPSTPLALKDLPNDVLVSVFVASKDPHWVRHTIPLVCKAWTELYLSKDASPLHEKLVVDFLKEAVTSRGEKWLDDEEEEEKEVQEGSLSEEEEEGGSQSEGDDESGVGDDVWSDAADADESTDADDGDGGDDESEEKSQSQCTWPASFPVVHASRVIAWAARRADSVRTLSVGGGVNGAFRDFSSEDLGALVAVLSPCLDNILVDFGRCDLEARPLWEALRDSVAPAGRLRALLVKGSFDDPGFEACAEALGTRQLSGSLQCLELRTLFFEYKVGPDSGLPRFPESFWGLTELEALYLIGHFAITALPAGIASLQKLKETKIVCNLHSLPKELGELTGLMMLDVGFNKRLGVTLPLEEAFPAELGRLKSLRVLGLQCCYLRTIPAFVGDLESLEGLDLSLNYNLRIDAPLDFLVNGCPRLRVVNFWKGPIGATWPPVSLGHLQAFEAKLLAKNPNAKVSYDEG